MIRDKILIIANKISNAISVSGMLPLTRFDDKTSTIICQEVESFESVSPPKLIILYTSNDCILSTLKQIKSSAILKTSKILLIMEEPDNEILCSAFDIGIDNFVHSFDETTLFLSVISMLKTCTVASQSEKNALMRDVLIDNEFQDSFQVYFYDKTKNTLQSFLEERKFEYNIIMFSPSFDELENVSKHSISAIFTGSIRSDDIPVFLSGLKFFVLFQAVDEVRTKQFCDKLRNKFEASFHLIGVSSAVGTNLENTVNFLADKLEENSKSGLEYNFYGNIEGTTSGDSEEENGEEDYLKAKSKFWKNFSELTTPYFFRTKTVMESKFPDSVITDSVTEEETTFLIKQNNISGEIKITYPAYSRINASITFERNGESKNHKEFYETEDFSEQVLDEIFAELFAGYEMLIHEDYNE